VARSRNTIFWLAMDPSELSYKASQYAARLTRAEVSLVQVT